MRSSYSFCVCSESRQHYLHSANLGAATDVVLYDQEMLIDNINEKPS